jgi:hypothetical protein
MYRISPVLWSISHKSMNVYAIDRAPAPNTFRVMCSSRVKEDPASQWDSPSFLRLLPPENTSCSEGVTWASLPAWLSWIQTFGYTLMAGTDLSRLKPYSDLYIIGP